MKKSTAIFAGLCFIFVGSVWYYIWFLNQQYGPSSSHFRHGDEYSYFSTFPKGSQFSTIKGDSCGGLKGATSGFVGRSHYLKKYPEKYYRTQTVFHVFMHDGIRGKMPYDWASFEAWKDEPHLFEFNVACIPDIPDIRHHLEDPDGDVVEDAVLLKNGPLLLLYNDTQKVAKLSPEDTPEDAIRVGRHTLHVVSVNSCTGKPYERCATMLEDDVLVDFRVICWPCDKFETPEALQAAVLFTAKGGINFSDEYGLSGGYMVRESAFGSTGYIWGENDIPGSRAKARYNAIVQHIADKGTTSAK